MSQSKKPRKAYKPRRVDIPMMVETRDQQALDLRMAIETLIAQPSVDTYNAVSKRLITIGRVLGKQQFMEQAKQAMLDVAARFERVGKMGVSESEAVALRATAGNMDAALATVPVNRFHAADVKTRVWCMANGVEAA